MVEVGRLTGGKDETGTTGGGSLTLGSVLVEGRKVLDGGKRGGYRQDSGVGLVCGGSLMLGVRLSDGEKKNCRMRESSSSEVKS